jgi:hypothetical protein
VGYPPLSTATIGTDAYTTGLSDPVLQSLIILLTFVLLGIAAHVTALILAAYLDHFMMVLYFDSKF